MSRNQTHPRLVFLVFVVVTLMVVAVVVLFQATGRPVSVAPPATVSPTPSPSPTEDATRMYQSNLGYSIELAEGWRRSDVLSLRAPASSLVLVGADVFTRRTPQDERANLGGATGGPAGFWTLTVGVEKNRDGLGLRVWVAEGHVGFGQGQIIEDATIDGRPAINVTGGTRGGANYLVARGDDVVSIRYNTQGDPPAGATKADLDRMVASVRLAPIPVARATATAPAGVSTVTGIESFPLGALTGDWTLALRLRPDGATAVAELWAVEIHGERRILALRWEEPRSFTRTVLARQLSPDGKRIVLSTRVDPAVGAGYQLTVVEFATGATRVLVQGRDQRALTPAWSPDGSRVAYVRATDAQNDSALWVVDASGSQPRGPLANSGTVLGWSSDSSRVAYRTLDGRFGLVEVASGAQLVLGTLLQGEDDAAAWRQPTAPFRPQLVAAFSATTTGGEQTIAVYETPTSAPQIVLREPQPTDNSSYLREPRWKPSGPLLLYRRGSEIFTTGGFVNAGTSPVRIPLDGRVLRAEWVAGGSGIDSIVYIADGSEALSRGTSVRVALENGANGRTLFVPPAIEGTSDVTDIATVHY
jgi:hypothetical protein